MGESIEYSKKGLEGTHVVVEVAEEVNIGLDTPVIPILVEKLMTVEELYSKN